jgi:4-carboxymuconolactone decarboxylase
LPGLSKNGLRQSWQAGSRRAYSDEIETAYDAATSLLEGSVLAASVYERALGLFGQHGVNELICLVGHYCFVWMT